MEELQGLVSGAVAAGAPMVHGSDHNYEHVEDLKNRIMAHPRYPSLLHAYIDCQAVGAPPEIACLLEDIRREKDFQYGMTAMAGSVVLDPELDQFMDAYYDVLVKYRTDLARPFEEATDFLSSMESQLSTLCCGATAAPSVLPSAAEDGVAAVGSSEEEQSGGEAEQASESYSKAEEKGLKAKLLRMYSGRISTLKQEFSKRKKKGKLPKEARQKLLAWWNDHYRWPYPTESDKVLLAESTGLDQKQINNWFINQRKRHWKPSESMQFEVLDTLAAPFFLDT